jgi:hypothetical protein
MVDTVDAKDRRRARRSLLPSHLVLVALVALVAGAVGYTLPSRPAAAAPMTQTRSFYVTNASPQAAAKLGCNQGDTTGRMTLFFGAPTKVGNYYGATLWGGADRDARQIIELAKSFVRGYAWCRESSAYQTLLGIGTSTSGIDSRDDRWLQAHGRAWASIVKQVNSWAQRYYPGIATAYAGWDAEPSWSKVHAADQWMQGYNGYSGRRAMHVHNSADGCPRDRADNAPCNNGWNQHWVWRLSWWYDPALPMPQIYAITGINARQWQKIDEYGTKRHGDGMVFQGVMTQWGACFQMGGCVGTNNTATKASDFMSLFLNANATTRQAAIETATDIFWQRSS